MRGVKYIAAGFVVDAQELLSEFVKESSPEFSVFTHFWKKHNFAAIYLARSSSELQQFTHEIFQLTLKFLETSELFKQIGSVYMLYALFRNQIVEPPTRIRVLLKQYQVFLELRRLAIKEKYKALHYVIGYLMEHGFDCVAHPTLVGPRNSKHKMEMERKSLQVTCLLKDLEGHSIFQIEKNLIEEVQELSSAYAEAVKNIPFESNVFQSTTNLNMENQLKKLSKLVGAESAGDDSGTNSQSEKDHDNIGDRRARIKSTAFASKAWFRQLNPSDDEDEEESERITRSRAQRKSLFRKAKLPKVSTNEEAEESEKEVKIKRRKRKIRVPKEKRRIGRPKKGGMEALLMMEDDDISDVDEFRGIRKRGPTSRGSYLDRYIEQPFKDPIAEMTLLSSTSEEEEDKIVKEEKDDEPQREEETIEEAEEEIIEEAEEEAILTF